MDHEIQAIAQEVTVHSLQEYEQGVREELQNSTITAADVMRELNYFQELYYNYYNMIQTRRKAKGDQLQAENVRILKLKIEDEQHKIYTQFFRFQNAFNEYFGQKITMVFVDPEQHELIVADNDMGHVVQNRFGSLEYSVESAQKEILRNFEYDSSKLDTTADSVYFRWEAAKSALKRSVGLPIVWKIGPNEYDGRKVNNKGTIAEAYANFYLNSVEFPSSDLEHNVGTYVLDDTYGMFSVDNTLGFAIGDISRGGTNQYAVKSNRAGLMGMHKVYQYIKKIKTELAGCNDEVILQELMKKVSVSGTVKQVTALSSAQIQKEADSLISILGLDKI